MVFYSPEKYLFMFLDKIFSSAFLAFLALFSRFQHFLHFRGAIMKNTKSRQYNDYSGLSVVNNGGICLTKALEFALL